MNATSIVGAGADMAVGAFYGIVNSPYIRGTTDKIVEIIQKNYALIFGFALVYSMYNSLTSCCLGLGLGLSCYEGQFIRTPGGEPYQVSALISSPGRQALSLLIACVMMRICFDAVISYLAVAFLAGCHVRQWWTPMAPPAQPQQMPLAQPVRSGTS